MTTYTPSPAEALDDLARDILVAAYVAKDHKLTLDHAERLARRVRAKSADMIDDADRELLQAAANGFERLSTRIKAGARGATVRPRAKAASRPRPPSQGELVRRFDQQQLSTMFAAGAPFSVNDPLRSEREVLAQTRLLRERNRKAEEQRRRQLGLDEHQTERPWRP